MATLPDIYGRRPTPQDRGQVVGIQDRSATAAALQGLAGAAEGAGDAVHRVMQKRQLQEDADSVFRAETGLKSEYLQFERGELERAGVNAKGAGERAQQWWDDAAERFGSKLENQRQKDVFSKTFETAKLSGMEAILRHEGKQRNDSLRDSAQGSIETAIDSARANPSDERVAQSYRDIGRAVDVLAGIHGWDAASIDAAKSKYAEAMSKGLSTDAYERASLSVENGGDPRHSADWGRMNPGHQAVLLGRLNSAEQQRQAKEIAEQKRREHDATKELDTLTDYALTGAPMSRDYEDSVRSVTSAAGPQFSARADELIRIAQEGSGFGAQPLDQQAAALSSMERQVQSGGGSPDVQKRLAHLRSMHDRQQQAYKENPWQAAQRFGRLGVQAQEADITELGQVPGLITQRMKQISSVETMAGQPVSPLQPEEARQFMTLLNQSDEVQQSRALAQASTGLSLGQINALASQLKDGNKAYGIALRLGSENTTAGRMVSELVLRGHRAIRDKIIKRDDAALTGWRSQIAPLVQGTLGSEEAENDVIDAAFYVLAAQDVDGAKAPGFTRGFGSGAEDAVAMVVGQPVTLQGVKTLLPRGMKESDFFDAMHARAPDQVKAIAPSGKVYWRGREMNFQTDVLPNLETYGMQRDPSGRYVPTTRGFMLTADPAGTIPLAIRVP